MDSSLVTPRTGRVSDEQARAKAEWIHVVNEADLNDYERRHCLSPDNLKRWWPLATEGEG